ncbi:prolipoprotein diacylglyceryl transferase, partial [Mycobacterium sp. AT1]|uniref:prolipoprotein diacylglyceryl transferase n=1 Tax=Mycobacterium sp. AT1 TaxID=1961706 RepID=UPI0009D5689D
MTTTVLAFIPSPSQGVWHLFGVLPIRAYALCIITGIVAALVIGDRRWEARGGERGVIYDIALWAVPFGLIGGRMYHVMTDWPKYFGADGAGFVAALRIWDGGLGIWGAVALGGVGAWIACRRRGIPLPAFADAVAPGIILAQAIGRLGNYFNQELYGRETDLPWGLTIYDRLDPSGVISPHSLDGVSTGQVYAVVHPTFLYELLWNLLVFAVLLWADRRFKLGHGRLFALYVAGYCVGRFWVELMRSDTASLIAGIRVNTFTSTFVFIGAVVYIMVAAKGREDPALLRGKDADHSLVDEVGEELVAVAATSGVVAAAKVAGDEDKAEIAGGADTDTESEAAAGTDTAEATAESSPSAFTGGADTDSEAAAEAEDLTEQVETASSEDIAEAEAFAEAGAEADEHREAGLGSVEGDEAVEAELGAVEAHEAAVDGAAEAEALAEEVTAEATTEDSIAAPEDG